MLVWFSLLLILHQVLQLPLVVAAVELVPVVLEEMVLHQQEVLQVQTQERVDTIM
jgi:hypothetical protein